jgi:uncharacterized protein (TIGR03118 family)
MEGELSVFTTRRSAVLVAAALLLLIGAPASASSPTFRFGETDQVSNQSGQAMLVDSDVVNAWGLALGPTTPLWVANNGSNTATLYSGGLNGATVGKVGLTVTVDSDGPTGQVFNPSSSDFTVTTAAGTGPARFIFDSESGDIAAWAPAATGTHAVVQQHVDGAVFKGLALWPTPLGSFLLATDFIGGHVDVFDSHFQQVDTGHALFADSRLPRGYAPFDVMVSGDRVFVTYAKQQAGSEDEAHGPGLGIVDEYTDLGTRVHRVATHGTLNAPWGLAIAPAGFGNLGGDLLVGNFGDGRINVFHGSDFIGQLRNPQNRAITIDGLWALLPGTATTGGTNTVWFSAGPHDENDGLVGQLFPSG